MEDLNTLACILNDAIVFMVDMDKIEGQTPRANRAILDLTQKLSTARSAINQVLLLAQKEEITVA